MFRATSAWALGRSPVSHLGNVTFCEHIQVSAVSCGSPFDYRLGMCISPNLLNCEHIERVGWVGVLIASKTEPELLERPDDSSMKLGGGMEMKFAMAVLALLFFAGAAHADSNDSTTYNYTGNTLNNSGLGSMLDPDAPQCQCNITGEMTFAQPLNLPTDIESVTGTPTSYSFSVDGYTLTQANSSIEQFNIGELWWNLTIQGNNGLVIITDCQNGCGDDGGATDFAGFNGTNGMGVEVGEAGKWKTRVPEPATYYMLLTGIMTLLTLRRCRIGANEAAER
jgi:hypothetical protein